MNIVDKHIDQRYKHYKQLKNLKKKSKAEKIVILLLLNLCIYGYLVSGMDKTHSFTIKNTIAEEAQASTIDVCGLEVVDCPGEDKNVSQVKYEGIEKVIADEFGDNAKIAIAIAKAESHLNPNAKGDMHIEFTKDGITMGHSCGVFQIRVLPGRPDCETLKDPEFNIKYAKQMFDRSGFTPWSAYKNGTYLKYIK